MSDSSQSLDFAERWLRDGLAVLRPAISVYQIQVDMTTAHARLTELRREGVTATATHLIVRAAARALAEHPALHQLVTSGRRLRPERVDIGLSVSGDTFVTPVLVVEGADQKSVAALVEEIGRRTPEVQASDRQMLAALRRFGWVLPFGFLRRGLLRLLFSSPTFRRKGVGTFQVSIVPTDWAMTATFSTAGVLIAGQTRSRVVVVDGQPAVRPTILLTLSSDHGVWDGRNASQFLAAVRRVLEQPADD